MREIRHGGGRAKFHVNLWIVSPLRGKNLKIACRVNAIPEVAHIGVDLAGILRGTHGERRRSIGVEWGGVWWGVSPIQPTRGSEGASWSPPVGFGAEPRPKTDFGVFWRPHNAPFCIYMTKIWGGQFALASPYSKLWGICLPRPPVIYAHALIAMWLTIGLLNTVDQFLTSRMTNRLSVDWPRSNNHSSGGTVQLPYTDCYLTGLRMNGTPTSRPPLDVSPDMLSCRLPVYLNVQKNLV